MRKARIGLFSSFVWIGAYNPCTTAFIPHSKHSLSRRMSTLLEIEEKFQWSHGQDLASRLEKLGFRQASEMKFVDWYFDTNDNYLSLRDCWLRFREKAGQKGKWELKRRPKGQGQNTSSTVYEEMTGKEAIDTVLAMTPESKKDERRSNLDYNHPIPSVSAFEEKGIQPFCRLETRRSSWQVDDNDTENKFLGLRVDLDETDTGHSVGEVESVVQDASQVQEAKERVKDLVAKLTDGNNSSDGPAIGKLEDYLIKNRPGHYEACLKAGVLKR